MSKASTGIAGLDDVLHGGLERNRMYAVLSEPGMGKTTLALQFLLDGLRQGERCLYVTLTETREEVEQVARSHGWSIDGLSIFEFRVAEARMVRDLLDTQRLLADGRLPLSLAPCDLDEVARDVLDGLGPAGERVHAKGAGRSIRGLWDRSQLQRATWNLVTNALKYGAPNGPVEILVRDAGAHAELSVHNEGPAIPAREQAVLFEPYRRAPTASGREGWGLGLTFVRGCADSHGGSITVESRDGFGTTFTLRLPWDSRPFQAAHSATEGVDAGRAATR